MTGRPFHSFGTECVFSAQGIGDLTGEDSDAQPAEAEASKVDVSRTSLARDCSLDAPDFYVSLTLH